MAPRYQFCKVLYIFTVGHLFPLQVSLRLTELIHIDFSVCASEHIMMIGQVIFPLICTISDKECRNFVYMSYRATFL